MDDLDAIILGKEKEIREIQILKIQKLEKSVQEKDLVIQNYEEKLKDWSLISNAKDIEFKELQKKFVKSKQNFEEINNNLALITEENTKYHDKLLEKDSLIVSLQETIKHQEQELSEIYKKNLDITRENEENIQNFNQNQYELERTNEDLKADLRKCIENYEDLQENYKIIQQKSLEMQNLFNQKEKEYEENIENLLKEKQSFTTLHNNFTSDLKLLNDKLLKKKKKNHKLLEKLQQSEFKVQKTMDETHFKIIQAQQTLEKELKSYQSQLEIKEFHYNSLLQEKLKSQEKNREYERLSHEKQLQIEQLVREKQEKSHECAQLLSLKEQELTRLKQETQKELENNLKLNKKTSDKLQDLEKMARHYQQKFQELERENNVLIQEIVSYRRMNLIPSSNQNQASFPQQQNIEITKQIKKNERVFPSSKLTKEIYGIEDLKKEINEEEVHSVLFSEDMGPATPIRLSPKKVEGFKRSTFLTKSAEMELRKKVKELDNENLNYKRIIENMADEMQNVKSKLQLSQQIKEDNVFRLQRMERELDEKIEENKVNLTKLDEKNKEIIEMKKNHEKLMQKNQSLIEERQKLIEISQKLSAKIRVFEDEDSEDDESFLENENKYSRRIKSLEQKLLVLEGEIIKWKEIESKKNELIEKLKKKIIDAQRNPLTLAEYDEIRELKNEDHGDLEEFKRKLNDLQAEINKELKIEVKRKTLFERNDQNLEKNLLYQKNSEKETISQKKIEEKLQTKKKSPKIMPKIRNYNIKT